MRRVVKILQAAGYVVLEFLVVVNPWLMAQRLPFHETVPSLLGYTSVYVLPGSMEPTFSAGDVVLITEGPEYWVGDAAAYQMGSQTVTHRIIGEEDGQFLLQGNVNNTLDVDPVEKEQILEKQAAVVPYLGWLISLSRTPVDLVVLISAGVVPAELPYRIGDKEGDP